MLDWLSKLVNPPDEDTQKKLDDIRQGIQATNSQLYSGKGLPSSKTIMGQQDQPVQAFRSDLLGNILSGIPNVNGFPITKQTAPEEPVVPESTTAEESEKVEEPKQEIKPVAKSASIKSPKTQDDDLKDSDIIPVKAPTLAPETVATPASVPSVKQEAVPVPQANPLDAFISQLAKAQQDRKNNLMMQGLIRAGQTAGSAIAGVAGDKNYLNNFDELVNEPVKSVEESLALQKQVQEAKRQAQQDSMQKEKFALDKQQAEISNKLKGIQYDSLVNELNNTKAMNDPNSVASEATRSYNKYRFDALNKATGKQLFDPNSLNNMSGTQMEKVFGKFSPETVADTLIKSDATKQLAAQRAEERALSRQEASDRHAESVAVRDRYIDQRKDAVDRAEHTKILQNLAKDKNLTKYIANYGNLNQVLTKINDPNVKVTPQILHDMQNILVQSMGNISAGGVEERKNRDMVTGAGIDWAKFKGYMKSRPEEVSPAIQREMFSQFKNLLDNEQVSTAAIVNPIIKRLSTGHKSMYDRRPDLAGDLQEVIKANTDLFGSHVTVPSSMTGRATAPSTPAPAPSNKVHVTNGRVIYEIDPLDLNEALRDGFQVL